MPHGKRIAIGALILRITEIHLDRTPSGLSEPVDIGVFEDFKEPGPDIRTGLELLIEADART